MKVLIAIVNCHNRKMYADTQRDTWVTMIPAGIDYKFFLGPSSDREPKIDEVFLDCDDSYQGLPGKVREIIRWAKIHDYDFMLKCDDDVVLLPEKFISSGFSSSNFVGHRNNDGGTLKIPYGFCYTLSRKAMDIMSEVSLPDGNNDEAWIARVLYDHNIQLHHDPRYHLYKGKKEDFVIPKPKPLRAPPRPAYIVYDDPVEGTFAYCMYIPWVGYRELSKERNLEEFRRVFEKVCQQQKAFG